jgi:hypothetical protein
MNEELDDLLIDLRFAGTQYNDEISALDRNHITDRIIETRGKILIMFDALEQKNEKLLSALMSMTYQYLSYSPREGNDTLFTHDFISAGEETLALLVELGIMLEIKPSYFKLVNKGDK